MQWIKRRDRLERYEKMTRNYGTLYTETPHILNRLSSIKTENPDDKEEKYKHIDSLIEMDRIYRDFCLKQVNTRTATSLLEKPLKGSIINIVANLKQRHAEKHPQKVRDDSELANSWLRNNEFQQKLYMEKLENARKYVEEKEKQFILSLDL